MPDITLDRVKFLVEQAVRYNASFSPYSIVTALRLANFGEVALKRCATTEGADAIYGIIDTGSVRYSIEFTKAKFTGRPVLMKFKPI